ncbi:MAG: hypothetical protein PHS82_01935 [Lachnospiraceae bacterium]|nr:hypothetical protein [Lachnospiraceae bacterium]
MKKDMNRVLIETAVNKALKDIRESPERTIRNLIDLGLNFTNGRFQKNFFGTAQKMLRNEKSAYYTLCKDAITSVDQRALTTFGINLGYNSCTRGAKIIREIEAQRNINIPWSLTLIINHDKLKAEPDFYPSVMEQGRALGIHTYFLFVTGDPESVIPLLQSQPECAFILFLRGNQITDSFIEQMKSEKNAMIAVYADADIQETCKTLRSARLLYAVYLRYTEEDRKNIVTGQWLSDALSPRPLFAFLMADVTCSAETQQEVYAYILSVRSGQKQPVLFMDMKRDVMMIDEIISDGVCMVGFDPDGSLRTHQGIRREPELNILQNPLADILQRAMKK